MNAQQVQEEMSQHTEELEARLAQGRQWVREHKSTATELARQLERQQEQQTAAERSHAGMLQEHQEAHAVVKEELTAQRHKLTLQAEAHRYEKDQIADELREERAVHSELATAAARATSALHAQLEEAEEELHYERGKRQAAEEQARRLEARFGGGTAEEASTQATTVAAAREAGLAQGPLVMD